VLKDAASTAIYGANGANGVVIITTKTGREGRTTVSFSSQVGTTDRIREYEVFNAQEYGQYWEDGIANTVVSRFGPQNEEFARDTANGIFGDPDSVTVDTDWQDVAFRTGITQQYDVSLNGGNEDTRFFISGRYTNDEGQVIQSQFEQFSLRLNLDHDVNEKFSVETRTTLASGRTRGTIQGGAFINSPFWSAQFIAPNSPVYNNPTPENNFEGDPETGFNNSPGTFGTFSFNPIQQETLNDREANINTLFTQVAANYEITDGFFSRTFAGISHEDSQGNSFRDPSIPAQAPGTIAAFDGRQTSFNINQSFSYTGRIGEKNDVSGLLVTEYREESFNNISTDAEGARSDFRTVSDGGNPTTAASFETEFRQISFVADGDYTYDGRYQVRGTVRVDGNSRFGEDNRFGVFGSLSAFWRLSEESFMEDVSFLDDLRLRASYGETGNSDIGNFPSRNLASAIGDYQGLPGVVVNQLGNAGLTWERVQDINLGLDYAVFNSRINGAIDVYRRDRTDQLLARDLPDDSGFFSRTENVAETRSQGVEFFIETTNVDYKGFRWSTNFNIAFQDTEVLDVGGNGRDVDGDGEVDEITVGGLVYREGEEVGQWRTPLYAGVNPANGRPMYRTPGGELTYFADEDNINQPLVGNLQADFFGGFGNTFSYKGLQLDMFWQFDYGRTTLDNNFFFNNETFPFNKNVDWLDYWREPGDVTDTPAPLDPGFFVAPTYEDGTTASVFTSRFFTDASYIRLKQLQLSYDLPQSLTQRVGLSRLQIFALGENIVTITDFTGPDPELVGTAIGEFPQARTITGGVRVEI
jgi:TonB-linked SusC/RagA family outer membrane protein